MNGIITQSDVTKKMERDFPSLHLAIITGTGGKGILTDGENIVTSRRRSLWPVISCNYAVCAPPIRQSFRIVTVCLKRCIKFYGVFGNF